MMPVEKLVERRRSFRPLDVFILFALTAGLIIFLLWRSIFEVVPPGNVAVLFSLFGGGTKTSRIYHEGSLAKWPWNTLYVYEVRTQAREYSVDALSADGLTVHVDFTTLFHAIPDEVPLLHKEWGPDYIDRLVSPVSLEAVRHVIGQFDPHTLYTVGSLHMQTQILERLHGVPRHSHIVFESVIIRNIRLPEPVNVAINSKLAEEQYAQAYDFRIIAAKKEAERKHIEAVGIQNFYSIVANSLTPSLLTWRGIEATVEISRSPNSKLVIMGGGKNQLPLILGSEVSNLPAAPNPAPVTPESHPLPDLNKLPTLFPETDLPSSESQQRQIEPNSKSTPTTPAAQSNKRVQKP